MFPMMASAYFQDAAGGGASAIWNLIVIVFIFMIFYFLLIRPQLKQQKQHQNLVNNLKKGDKVITTGGIWGEIDSVEPQFVRLKINEKNKIAVTRTAISGFQPKPGEEESKS